MYISNIHELTIVTTIVFIHGFKKSTLRQLGGLTIVSVTSPTFWPSSILPSSMKPLPSSEVSCPRFHPSNVDSTGSSSNPEKKLVHIPMISSNKSGVIDSMIDGIC